MLKAASHSLYAHARQATTSIAFLHRHHRTSRRLATRACGVAGGCMHDGCLAGGARARAPPRAVAGGYYQ